MTLPKKKPSLPAAAAAVDVRPDPLEPHVRFATTMASVTVIVGVAVATVLLAYTLLKPKVYDPFVFPVREPVLNTVKGVSGPAMHLGAPLRLSSIECSKEVRSVPTRIVIEFRQIQPPGPDVPFLDPRNSNAHYFDAFFPGGCSSQEQDIPTALITSATKALFDKGTKQVTWQLSGTVTAHHAHAKVTPFQSDNFTVVP